MKELQSFLTSQELIIVYTVVGVLIMGLIIFIISKKTYNYRKKRHNTKELNKLVTEVHDRIEEDKTNNKVNEAVMTETLEPIPEIIENIKEELNSTEEEVDIMENNDINPVMGLKEGILTPSSEILSVDVPEEEIYKQEDSKTVDNNPIVEQLEEIEVLEDLEDTPSKGSISMPVEIVEIKPNMEKVEDKNVEIKPTEVEPVVIDELEYEDDMDQTKAQQEIEKLTQELVNANATVDNIELTNFEEEQEKNAIISLDEFLKLGDSLYNKNEVTQYQDDKDVPISLEDLEKKKNESIVKDEVQKETLEKQVEVNQSKTNMSIDDFYTIKTPKTQRSRTTKFKRSPVISPVYGIEKPKSEEVTMELENTANYEKLDEEIRKTNEFLSTLRELQEKLD